MKKKDSKRANKDSNNAKVNYSARIKIVGVGGAGGNIVSRMASDIPIRGLEFIAINTDAQALDYCAVRKKIYIGKNLTRGLGSGMNPDIGRQAAEENKSDIAEAVTGADIVFITSGLGGGTGSGAVSLVAETARESGALTIAVVTKPFAFEGTQRGNIAEEALSKLREKVDTLIVVPNDRIFGIIRKDTPLLKAFEHIDDVLRQAVQGIAELISMPGIVNVDFADVRAIMHGAGQALIGIGKATGQDRAVAAVNQAVNSPLLEIALDGAKGVLFGVAGSRDLKMNEINEVAKVIAASVDPGAKIIFGAYHDRKLRQGMLKVTLVATGFNGQFMRTRETSYPTSLFTPEEGEYEKRELPIGEDISDKKNGKVSNEEKDSREEVWEIPTFLRKKK